ELRDVAVGMDLDPVAYPAFVVDDRVAPHRYVVTDLAVLADDHVVARLEPCADAGSEVDHCAAADDRVRAEYEGRRPGPGGPVADDGARIRVHALPHRDVRQPVLLPALWPRAPPRRPGPPGRPTCAGISGATGSRPPPPRQPAAGRPGSFGTGPAGGTGPGSECR